MGRIGGDDEIVNDMSERWDTRLFVLYRGYFANLFLRELWLMGCTFFTS